MAKKDGSNYFYRNIGAETDCADARRMYEDARQAAEEAARRLLACESDAEQMQALTASLHELFFLRNTVGAFVWLSRLFADFPARDALLNLGDWMEAAGRLPKMRKAEGLE